MKMNLPIQKFSDYTTYKGDTIEVIGEVFNEPIKENESIVLYTRIQILHKNIEVAPTIYFAEQLSFDDLDKNVNHIKKNITQYIK